MFVPFWVEEAEAMELITEAIRSQVVNKSSEVLLCRFILYTLHSCKSICLQHPTTMTMWEYAAKKIEIAKLIGLVESVRMFS